ncbi:MAG TPA: low-specificity L-threonine aldolase [Acidimicrobiales bacterium]|nr:low-specificity L-threonine aldolase [Acidimicrobiales bacterium]
MPVIDLRSDTVTRPTPAMRRAMAEAEVGDDVFGEDPTVNRLQALAAERFGTEAALFVPSGTQSNLVALLAHCQRGDEYIAGQQAHTYRWEGGGGAVLGGINPQPLENEPDGTLDLARVAAAVKPFDDHFARTRLLCLENTISGRALPLDYGPAARAVAERHGLAVHLDGARIANAAVHHGVEPVELTRDVDTVSVCLSKGLGAPAGSVLCGPAEVIAAAHRWRKVTGGGMRQAGILAAAGIVALTEHVDRLADDHANAAALAAGLAGIDGVEVTSVATNMVFASFAGLPVGLRAALAADGIAIIGDSGGGPVRLVTHLDVSADDIDVVVAAVARYATDAG